MRCAVAVAVAVVLVAASVGADDIRAAVSFGKFGSVDLIQRDGAVQITANLTNLPQGQHGFHVHQYGDIFTNGCTSTGGHFNPDKVDHGAPSDSVRHVGDLGNILANGNAGARLTCGIVYLVA